MEPVREVVAKAPYSFLLTGDYGVIGGHRALVYPIPRFTTVEFDLQHSTSCEIHLAGKPASGRVADGVSRAIEDLVRESLGGGYGFRLHAKPDFPQRCGLNWSGSISAAASVATNLAVGNITTEQLNDWAHKLPSALLQDKEFVNILQFSMRLETILDPESIYLGSLAALIPSIDSLPFVVWLDESNQMRAQALSECIPSHLLENAKGTLASSEFSLVFAGERPTDVKQRVLLKGIRSKSDRFQESLAQLIRADQRAESVGEPQEVIPDLDKLGAPNFIHERLLEAFDLIYLGFLKNLTSVEDDGRQIEDLKSMISLEQGYFEYLKLTSQNMNILADVSGWYHVACKAVSFRGGDVVLFAKRDELRSYLNDILRQASERIESMTGMLITYTSHYNSWDSTLAGNPINLEAELVHDSIREDKRIELVPPLKLDDHQLVLLGKLFPDELVKASEIQHQGASGAKVIHVETRHEGSTRAPASYLVKMGKRESIEKEMSNYEKYVKNIIPNNRYMVIDTKKGLVDAGKVSGLAGSFFQKEYDEMMSLARYYLTHEVDEVNRAIDNLFNIVSEWRKDERPAQENEFQFDCYIGCLQKMHHDFDNRMKSSPVALTEIRRVDTSANGGTSTRRCLSHGDLRFSNIYVDKYGFAYLIDYGSIDYLPRLVDFVELETSLKFEVAEFESDEDFYIVESTLANQPSLGDAIKVPTNANDVVAKCIRVVESIRRRAKEKTNCQIGEYLYALQIFTARWGLFRKRLTEARIRQIESSSNLLVSRLGQIPTQAQS